MSAYTARCCSCTRLHLMGGSGISRDGSASTVKVSDVRYVGKLRLVTLFYT